ncbi:Hsp20/alpha crystallin family protein [Pseudonocardia kujensis]|uniref:Hsp20/alpha crystallin family protein n=1 Tax=Pseudonocardia kujensis TaxID=1128675 RepID=UPI001E4C7546|nr:Hsp20/alpha crystallin family protein [Pseudonocardia kujensis]MCE0767298.1 Hsp20/alpha crystallin family protein [Pseudonocardia kujensis]
MLMRVDPFGELDRLARQAFGAASGTWSRPAPLPMDAYRHRDTYVVEFDLPGVAAEAVELTVERNVLTVKAERRPTTADEVQMQISERPLGVFSRQVFLGEGLDTDHIQADYHDGVLTLRIPVAEKAKPRSIAISTGSDQQAVEA